MRADFKVVLDACVLANFGVCDLFLRLAETPRLYLPRWTDEILAETQRTHVDHLGWPPELAARFQHAARAAFPEALVSGYEPLIEQCRNDPKDRHVLACAIKAEAEVIATFNLKDFPPESLSPWKTKAIHPQNYLITLYSIDPVVVLHKIEETAHKRGIAVEDHLISLGTFLPTFSQRLLGDLGE